MMYKYFSILLFVHLIKYIYFYVILINLPTSFVFILIWLRIYILNISRHKKYSESQV